jgi:hypothetical protein
MKIACLFINITLNNENNYYKYDTFFIPNAINSFKKWNPEIDIHYINDDNFLEYCNKLGIESYYENVGLLKIHIGKKLFEKMNYQKVISLGVDTLTCAKVDEFINNNTDDLICTSGAFHCVINKCFTTPVIEFTENNNKYIDIAFINGDVICINNVRAAQILYDVSLDNWESGHAEQGGMNICFIKQDELKLKVSIVDFPYYKTSVLYNIRSKGVIGGYCMIRGNVLDGRRGKIISTTYPTSQYYVRDHKLFTSDNKQIKIFHFCETLGGKSPDDELTIEEQINEMKTMWFNSDTIEFLKKECDCIF